MEGGGAGWPGGATRPQRGVVAAGQRALCLAGFPFLVKQVLKQATTCFRTAKRARLPKKEEEEKSACRNEGSAVGPLLAALRCRCAALLVP
jgi:hypothetical protein